MRTLAASVVLLVFLAISGDAVSLKSGGNEEGATVPTASAIGGDLTPTGQSLAAEDASGDDESRLEPLPRERSSLDRFAERETAHKPTPHDLLMRQKAQEAAKKLQSQIESDEADLGSGDVNQANVAPVKEQIVEADQVVHAAYSGVEMAASESTESKSAVDPAEENEKTAQLRMDPKVGSGSSDQESKGPVVYSLEGDMMSGQETVEKEDLPVAQEDSKKDSAQEEGSTVPMRYTAGVDTGLNETAAEGKDAAEESSDSDLRNMLGASRQFGAIPVEVPFSESLLLETEKAPKSYENHTVVRATIDSKWKEALMFYLATAEEANCTMWGQMRMDRHSDNVTFSFPSESTSFIETSLADQNITYRVLTNNLQDWIDAERRELGQPLYKKGDVEGFAFDKYHPFEEISDYLDSLVEKYPSLVQPLNLGKTYEKNDIRGVVVSKGGRNKPVLYIDSGTHAREWISAAATLYLLQHFVSMADSDPEVKAILDRYDLHIIPILNPDGYKHSWKGDRLWRKNRVRFAGYNWCAGVDINRNYDYLWGEIGTSSSPCRDIYAGSSAFSELETRAVRDHINSIKHRMSLFMAVHSYGQMLLLPYGAGPIEQSPAYAEQMAAAIAFRDAIKEKSNQIYHVGTTRQLLYPASGLSKDWAHSLGVKYSYTAELRDEGDFGFMLPAQYIIPTGEEFVAGFKALVQQIIAAETGPSLILN